ncbi:MAG: TPM domain-containing protein [Flavobacteriaceae bacterium]|nr:TPM domain-containing protein [Flavobacteriaceae bacterium]
MLNSIEEFLSATEEKQVIEAIRTAELNTSGEIRVHLEGSCQGNSYERALEVFSILKMDNTKLQNAVLIYVAVHDHSFTICGDEGINLVVPNDFWDSTKDIIEQHFRKKEFSQGLVAGIIKVGEQLKAHFPWDPRDQNELPDSISKS